MEGRGGNKQLASESWGVGAVGVVVVLKISKTCWQHLLRFPFSTLCAYWTQKGLMPGLQIHYWPKSTRIQLQFTHSYANKPETLGLGSVRNQNGKTETKLSKFWKEHHVCSEAWWWLDDVVGLLCYSCTRKLLHVCQLSGNPRRNNRRFVRKVEAWTSADLQTGQWAKVYAKVHQGLVSGQVYEEMATAITFISLELHRCKEKKKEREFNWWRL